MILNFTCGRYTRFSWSR